MRDKILSSILLLAFSSSWTCAMSAPEYFATKVVLDSSTKTYSSNPIEAKMIYFYDPLSRRFAKHKAPSPDNFQAPDINFLNEKINEGNVINFIIPKQMIPGISNEVKIKLELDSLEPVYVLARDIYSKKVVSKVDPGRTISDNLMEFDQDHVLEISFQRKEADKPYELNIAHIGCMKVEKAVYTERESIVEDPIEALSTLLFLIENGLTLFESGFEFIERTAIIMSALKANFTEAIKKISEFTNENPDILNTETRLVHSDRAMKRYAFGVSLFLSLLAPEFFDKHKNLFLLRDDADFKSRPLTDNVLDITKEMLRTATENDERIAWFMKGLKASKENKKLFRNLGF